MDTFSLRRPITNNMWLPRDPTGSASSGVASISASLHLNPSGSTPTIAYLGTVETNTPARVQMDLSQSAAPRIRRSRVRLWYHRLAAPLPARNSFQVPASHQVPVRCAVTFAPRTISAPSFDAIVKLSPSTAAMASNAVTCARQSIKFGYDTEAVGRPTPGLLSEMRTSRSGLG